MAIDDDAIVARYNKAAAISMMKIIEGATRKDDIVKSAPPAHLYETRLNALANRQRIVFDFFVI